MATFAERLRQLRKEQGLTQQELADRLGMSRSTIGGYEAPSKRREPDFEVVRRLAAFFGVSVDYLLGSSDIRTVVSSEGKRHVDQTEDDVDLSKLDEMGLTVAAMRPDMMDMMEGFHELSDEAKELLKDLIRDFYKRFGKKKSDD